MSNSFLFSNFLSLSLFSLSLSLSLFLPLSGKRRKAKHTCRQTHTHTHTHTHTSSPILPFHILMENLTKHQIASLAHLLGAYTTTHYARGTPDSPVPLE